MICDHALVPPGPEDAKYFRDVCLAAGYTLNRLSDVFGMLVPPPSDRLPVALSASLGQAGAPFDVLARLFFLGLPVDAAVANTVLPSGFMRLCLQCGLASEDAGEIRPLALVVPVDGAFLASDLQKVSLQDEDGFVPTLCDAALHLDAVSIKTPVAKTLDLCCGFALHGILSSSGSDSVVVSDLNPRAAEFARFNAALNDCENLTAVTGDLFEQVADQRFDRILANPPFIISPEAVTTYRYSPFELDGFVQKMFAEAPEYLNEGGVLQAICEWVELEGECWQERVKRWFADSGCDVWVLPANRQLPASYARSVLQQATSDEAELAAQQAIWEGYFRDQRVAAIHGGFIFARRRQAENWFDVTELTKPIRGAVGEAIAGGFASRDLVFDPHGDEKLLNSKLVVSGGVRQVETSHWKDFRWQRDSIVLHLDDGLPVTIGVDEYVRALIEKFDGARSVAECLDLFSEQVGLPAETGREQGSGIVRSMLRNGVLAIRRSVAS